MDSAVKLVSAGKEGRHETSTIQRGTDHRNLEGGGSGTKVAEPLTA
jgi:hypothetical protein